MVFLMVTKQVKLDLLQELQMVVDGKIKESKCYFVL